MLLASCQSQRGHSEISDNTHTLIGSGLFVCIDREHFGRERWHTEEGLGVCYWLDKISLKSEDTGEVFYLTFYTLPQLGYRDEILNLCQKGQRVMITIPDNVMITPGSTHDIHYPIDISVELYD